MESFKRLIQDMLGKPKAWTKDECVKLLLAIHVDRQSPIKALGRTRADCESQYEALYEFTIKQILDSEGNFDPIDSHYMAIEDMNSTDTDQKPWSKEETLALFNTGQREVPHRSKAQCFHHYYDVAGTAFRKLGKGLPLEKALLRAVDEFYKVTYQAEGSIS
jgi:hypothetical protein